MSAAGPFSLGDRVYIRSRDTHGYIDAIGPTQTIRVYEGGMDAGLRCVTLYDVVCDYGSTLTIADRDGHIVLA